MHAYNATLNLIEGGVKLSIGLRNNLVVLPLCVRRRSPIFFGAVSKGFAYLDELEEVSARTLDGQVCRAVVIAVVSQD